ncbi:SpoIIE family protein phosphatase [Flavobacterium sp. RNTU_13]|uniref:SpoIIE family protein phosphatase n=1 Tax=Flavobacterium sp. RNTU_13 TaxID=3375145 RepID=UPI00398653B8
MDNAVLFSYKIDDRSYVSFIKREIHNLVTTAGFSPQKVGEIDIVVSELTSNLIKFAETGELLYRLANDDKGVFLEIYCLDKGKGIHNLSRMMQDGISSSDTLGQGLGAIERLSSRSSIFTVPDSGTVVYSKIYQKEPDAVIRQSNINFGAVQVCAPGETVCGDGYSMKKLGNGIQFFMGDGLGHGINAHEAVTEAIASFTSCRATSPVEVLRYIHENVKKTRGLVVTIAYLEYTAQKWYMCGIGNISTSLYTGLVPKNYMPYNGIVGHNIPRTLNDSVMEFEKYQTLIMHSDGLRARWNLSELPGILKYEPNVISAALYKDNARHNDDMTVFAAKINL